MCNVCGSMTTRDESELKLKWNCDDMCAIRGWQRVCDTTLCDEDNNIITNETSTKW